jgi:hypothetical protein
MRPARVELHIDELVLDGFAPQDRFRIGSAVEHELTRLLSGHADAASFFAAELRRVDGGSFSMRHGSRPETIGSQVARAVYAGIGKGTTRGG